MDQYRLQQLWNHSGCMCFGSEAHVALKYFEADSIGAVGRRITRRGMVAERRVILRE
jgi:hypothetical protein